MQSDLFEPCYTSDVPLTAIAPFRKDVACVIGEIETWAVDNSLDYLIGVDEAGRGPLAGPVHAAALLLYSKDFDSDWISTVDDSKKLKERDREVFEKTIRASSSGFEIVGVGPECIDEINILQATRRAMKLAVEGLFARVDLRGLRGCVVVDGNQRIDILLPQCTVVKGDQRSRAIAAASILAKTSRDREMLEADNRWPNYGFASHKGYGSKAHREAIATHGPCPIHRKSFKGVREYLDLCSATSGET